MLRAFYQSTPDPLYLEVGRVTDKHDKSNDVMPMKAGSSVMLNYGKEKEIISHIECEGSSRVIFIRQRHTSGSGVYFQIINLLCPYLEKNTSPFLEWERLLADELKPPQCRHLIILWISFMADHACSPRLVNRLEVIFYSLSVFSSAFRLICRHHYYNLWAQGIFQSFLRAVSPES